MATLECYKTYRCPPGLWQMSMKGFVLIRRRILLHRNGVIVALIGAVLYLLELRKASSTLEVSGLPSNRVQPIAYFSSRFWKSSHQNKMSLISVFIV